MISSSARSRKSSQVGLGITQTQHTCSVGNAANIKPASAQASQQVVDLVERLHRRRRVVDRRRECPNGNVDQQANRILWILQGYALLAEDDARQYCARIQLLRAAVDTGNRQAIGDQIADGIFYLDQGSGLGSRSHQVWHIEGSDHTRGPMVDDLLGRIYPFGPIFGLLECHHAVGRRIHGPDHLAAAVANLVEHI